MFRREMPCGASVYQVGLVPMTRISAFGRTFLPLVSLSEAANRHVTLISVGMVAFLLRHVRSIDRSATLVDENEGQKVPPKRPFRTEMTVFDSFGFVGECMLSTD